MINLFFPACFKRLGYAALAASTLLSSLAIAESPADARYIVRFKGEGAADLSTLSTASSQATSKASPKATKAFMQRGAAMVASEGGRVRLELPEFNAMAVELSEEQREALAGHSDVVAIEVDPPRYALAQEVPFGISLVQSDLVPYGPAPGIKVCVVDSLSLIHI